MLKLLPLFLLLSTTPYDMATKKYRPSNDNQITTRRGQFNPQQIGSAAGAMRQEFQRQRQQDAIFEAQEDANQRIVLDNLAQKRDNAMQMGKDMESMAQFSETLLNKVMDFKKASNEAEQVEGLNYAFTNGLDPEKAAAFDADYDALVEVDTAGRKAATEAQRQGADATTVKQIRKLSAWEAVGYAKGQAIMGGQRYGDFFQQAKNQVSFEIDGRQVTYDTAETVEERQEIEGMIRKSYLARFKDMNPALLNKFMFEQMHKYESAQAVQWNKQKERELEEEKQQEAAVTLQDNIRGGGGGKAILDFLNQHEGDFDNSPKKTREALIEILKPMIESGQIQAHEIQDMLGYEFKRRGDGKVVTLAEQFPDLATLYNTAVDARTNLSKQEDQLHEANRREFNREVRELVRAREESGVKPTEQQKQALVDKWKSQFGGPLPDDLSSMVTLEEEEDNLMKEKLELLLDKNGYITQRDLRGASVEVRAEYKDKVAATAALANVPKTYLTKGKKYANSVVLNAAGLTGGTHKLSDSPLAVLVEAKAQENFLRYFNEGLETLQSPDAAFSFAKEKLDKDFELKGGQAFEDLKLAKEVAEGDKDSVEQMQETQKVIKATKDRGLEVYKEMVIPGTEASLEKLVNFANNGIGEIPPIYRVMAARTQGAYSPWEIAEMQLQASGKGTLLPKPPIEVAVSEMPADIRRLLNFRGKSPGRAHRAMIGWVAGPAMASSPDGNWNTFLDMVASVESRSHGDYDAYNLGGSNGGHTAHGSGNSAEDGRFGKPLSQLTVNDVLSLGASGNIHAAGRYQFIHSTLKETVTEAGLTGNELFDAKTQDRLAIARARWRMKWDRGMAGLRREWIGLNYVPDAVLRPAMMNIVDTSSPYNKPENLSPALRKKVYSK